MPMETIWRVVIEVMMVIMRIDDDNIYDHHAHGDHLEGCHRGELVIPLTIMMIRIMIMMMLKLHRGCFF